MTDPRATLDRIIRERGEDYASLSRLLGRNPAYIQQFIRRGTPRKLGEDDRRTLARYLRIDEALLGGPTDRGGKEVRGGREAGALGAGARGAAMVAIPRLAVGASAGPGAIDGDERVSGVLGLDARFLRELTASPDRVTTIRVVGDSMVPILADGDDILVDRSDGAARLRDGIYVLRFDDALNVKRIARNPSGKTFTVRSDNPAYPVWPDCDPARIDIIGRVIWMSRKLT